jgi:hypothetical protein
LAILLVPVLALAACSPRGPLVLPGLPSSGDTGAALPDLGVTAADVSVEAGYQGGHLGHFNRGRTALIGDLDGDGLQDVYVGNPGDPSYVLYNRTEPDGPLRFEPGDVLSQVDVAWGGGIADLDGDGDNDLLVTGGGNEEPGMTRLFRNEAGALVDGTVRSGIGKPLHANGNARNLAQAHAALADFDNDGVLDIFINGNLTPVRDIDALRDLPVLGTNVLWLGRRDEEAYVDVQGEVGIDSSEATQNSAVLDFDGDGDLDLYENTVLCEQHLWRNLLVETGELRFEDVTEELSLGGGDLRYPWFGFSTVAADFNNDGWEDVLVFVRTFEPPESPYQDGHVLLLNLEGEGFVDVAPYTGVNDPYVNWEEDPLRDHTGGGVMGSSAGDVNADGIPDVYVGQGGPPSGTTDIFFLSTGLTTLELPELGGRTVTIPQYQDASRLIDFPAPEDPAIAFDYPPYPYRSHAVNFVDFDRDGVLELTVQEGGPSWGQDAVREPDRLFRFELDTPPRWLAVQLAGNGVTVNRSAIGARVDLRVRRWADEAEWTLARWRRGGTGFASNNGQELYFGLGDADEIVGMTIAWPDGSTTVVRSPPAPGRTVRVDQETGEVDEVEPGRSR